MGMNNRAIGSIEQVGSRYIVEEVEKTKPSGEFQAYTDLNGVSVGLFHGGKFIARDFEELVSFLRKQFVVPVLNKQLTLKEVDEECGKCREESRGQLLSLEIE